MKRNRQLYINGEIIRWSLVETAKVLVKERMDENNSFSIYEGYDVFLELSMYSGNKHTFNLKEFIVTENNFPEEFKERKKHNEKEIKEIKEIINDIENYPKKYTNEITSKEINEHWSILKQLHSIYKDSFDWKFSEHQKNKTWDNFPNKKKLEKLIECGNKKIQEIQAYTNEELRRSIYFSVEYNLKEQSELYKTAIETKLLKMELTEKLDIEELETEKILEKNTVYLT